MSEYSSFWYKLGKKWKYVETWGINFILRSYSTLLHFSNHFEQMLNVDFLFFLSALFIVVEQWKRCFRSFFLERFREIGHRLLYPFRAYKCTKGGEK